MEYVALQVKTCYSILNSLNNISKLVEKASSYGYSFLAITDEDNMFGVMEFYTECQNHGIKPIIGMELSIKDKKILLYSKNLEGYKNLIKIATIRSQEEVSKEALIKYKENIIMVMPIEYYDKEIYDIYDDKYIGYSNLDDVKNIKEKKVYLNDVRYLDKKEAKYLDYAKMIQEGKTLLEYAFSEDNSHYLLNKEEVSFIPKEDLKNSLEIANKCNVTLEYTKGLLPIYDEKIESETFLHNLAYKGLNKRLNGKNIKEYYERLDYELKVINEMGFNDYFLIVYDYVLYAKKNKILVGPGRGSACGSLVSYSLGITDVDPIKYNLLFERFLNKERITMPDIDVDFDANKRMDVIDYVTNKYGEKKVVGIITFNTLGAKQVIRDVGKILSINPRMIDNIAKLCTDDLKESYKNSENLRKLIDNSQELHRLYDICLHLEGLPRHISVHAAGVVMSKYNLDETIPLYKNQMGMYVTGYSKDYLEGLGLLKMDFLGISNLTMIDEIINDIKEHEKINITFSNIPMDDKKTFELFKNGDTDGIFQFEKPGMIKFLRQLKVEDFKDIYAALSLYRPGPMESIPEYIKRRHGNGKIDYIDPTIEDELKETYGIIIYQEQIMQIACKVAGYSLGEADILRRAMSKKKEDILVKERENFLTRSIERGYSKDTINKIYDLILKFANYGFNKSHAVAYSIISYKMAFLKVHFFSYFMVNLLTSAINNEEKTRIYIGKIRQKGIKVLLPDINKSTDKYQTIETSIICPFSIIHNVGSTITIAILKERVNGEFTSFIDFCLRINKYNVNKKIISSLILAGVFSSFGYNKRTLIENLDNIMNYVELNGNDSLIKLEEPIINEYEEYSDTEQIEKEFESFGFYLTSHPVSKYKNEYDKSTLYLESYADKYLELILEINSIKEIVTKKQDAMAFVKASDEYRQLDLTIFPKIYKDNKNLEKYDIIKVGGRIEKRFDDYQLIVSKIIVLSRSKNEK